MPNIGSSYSFNKIAPWCVVVFFVIKVVMTSIWFIRPWDIPDEVGHISYIKDLATGKGIPVLHETAIDDEIWQAFAPEHIPDAGMNWIAQHPPLYHLLMVPMYWLGSLFSSSFWPAFYLIRIATAVLFGLGIWALIRAFVESAMSVPASIGLGIMVASVPNHTFIAGGVNHDSLVFLLGSCVLLFWIRFLKSGSARDLTWVGLCLGLGGLVKYTMLVLLPPLLAWTCLYLWINPGISWKVIVRFLLLAFLPIGIWMLRNWIHFEELLPIDRSGFVSNHPFEMSFFEFGQRFPVFTIVLKNFWGLLGWMGDGTFRLRWFQMYSIYVSIFTLPLLLLFGSSLFFAFNQSWPSRTRWSFGLMGAILLPALVFLSGWFGKDNRMTILAVVFGLSVFGWILGEGVDLIRNGRMNQVSWTELGCVIIFLGFTGFYFKTIYGFSVSSGGLQGTFGRYFLPVLGFAMIGLFGRGIRAFQYSGALFLGVAIIYSCAELYLWLHEVVPFFKVYA